MRTAARPRQGDAPRRSFGARMGDACVGFFIGAMLGAASYVLDTLFPELSPIGGSGFLTSTWSTALWFGGFAAVLTFVLGRDILDYFTVR